MINGFEWNQEKAASNIKKHSVLLGMSENLRVLVVIHCERDNIIRLISARTATKQERKQYKAHL